MSAAPKAVVLCNAHASLLDVASRHPAHVLAALALAALVPGCAHDPAAPVDVHAAATCDAAWMRNGFTDCELACADSTVALGAMGPRCAAKTTAGAPVDCPKTFVVGGVTGCCASDTPHLYFAECQ
jgi:hypothetical protein